MVTATLGQRHGNACRFRSSEAVAPAPETEMSGLASLGAIQARLGWLKGPACCGARAFEDDGRDRGCSGGHLTCSDQLIRKDGLVQRCRVLPHQPRLPEPVELVLEGS